MGIFNSILATIRFELSRVMTVQRLTVAIVMALFPPAMILILDSTGAMPPPEFIITVLCGMICLLSLLLWSTSNVYAELEGKSWAFVTTRPYGRWSILFGKYVIGFVLSFVISWVSLSICMWVASDTEFLTEQLSDAFESQARISDGSGNQTMQEPVRPQLDQEMKSRNGSESIPPILPPTPESQEFVIDLDGNSSDAVSLEGLSRFKIWLYLSVLLFLASMVYSAIFSLLGVVIQRRAMVFAVGYFIVVECIFAGIPALIGKIAMSFHMIALLIQWVGIVGPNMPVANEIQSRYAPSAPWVHLAAIFGMTLFMLGLAACIIRMREYITLDDAQV